MKILYLNNFRGFHKTFIDIRDINFFVGENSTGKTSVLKVLKSLLSSDFWITNNFDLSASDLGYFQEITSGLKGNNSYFEIGIADFFNNNAYKLKYIDSNGYPTISEINYVNQSFNLEVISINNNPRYRYSKNSNFLDDNFLEFFKIWVTQTMLGTEVYNDFSKDRNRYSSNLPLLFQIELELENINLDLIGRIPFSEKFYWFAPIRTNPKRIYDDPNSKHSPDGTHTPFILRDYLQSTADDSEREKKRKTEFILNKFGSDSGLFESVSIKQYEKDSTSPFQLQVVIAGKKLNFTNVGYGVSQILPLLTEIVTSPKGSIFSIQQPEVHLHPKGQAAFADFIYKSYVEENKTFIIETHSDYLIDRFRILLSKKTRKENGDMSDLFSQIVFFSRGIEGNQVNIIPINNNGQFCGELPKEYRDFFIKEQFDLLDI